MIPGKQHGRLGLLRKAAASALPPSAPLAVQVENVSVEVALQWCSDSFSDVLVGFVNNVKTIDGGTHLDGLKAALTRTINSLARKSKALKEGDANLSGDHIREGLTAIIHVKVWLQPQFS